MNPINDGLIVQVGDVIWGGQEIDGEILDGPLGLPTFNNFWSNLKLFRYNSIYTQV